MTDKKTPATDRAPTPAPNGIVDELQHLVILPLCLAVVFGISAFFLKDFWQSMMVAGVGAALAPPIQVAAHFLRFYGLAVRRYVPLIGFCILTGMTAYFGYSLWQLTRPVPYPRPDGTIIDFKSGPGGPALTVLGTQCSLLSDSANNLKSTVSYNRIDEPQRGVGFLRIFYNLQSTSASEPYAGIYCPFSIYKPLQFDVSIFSGVHVKVRWGRDRSQPSPDVSIVLYSRSPEGATYLFPTYMIPAQRINESWNDIRATFEEFVSPPHADVPVRFDANSAYQIGFVLEGLPHSTALGQLDIADVNFFK